MTWGTGQAIPRPIGTAGDDGQEIFRWRVMLRKGKLQLPYTHTAKKHCGEEGRRPGRVEELGHVASRARVTTRQQLNTSERKVADELL